MSLPRKVRPSYPLGLLEPIGIASVLLKNTRKRGHVKIEIDDRQECGPVRGNPAEVAGSLVASSRLARFKKTPLINA